jgi:hypothetical protein
MQLSEKDQLDRGEFWRYYMGALDELDEVCLPSLVSKEKVATFSWRTESRKLGQVERTQDRMYSLATHPEIGSNAPCLKLSQFAMVSPPFGQANPDDLLGSTYSSIHLTCIQGFVCMYVCPKEV